MITDLSARSKEIVGPQQDGIPECFVLPPHLQPCFSTKCDPGAVNLPLIDMTGVHDNPERRKQAVASVIEACNTWGFFQVVGHGIVEELRERMLARGREFFQLPMSEKAKYHNDWREKSKPILGRSRLSTGGLQSWRESFRHKSAPVSEAEMEDWPIQPDSYRETVMEYSQATKKLATTILELIAEGLNLNGHHFYAALGGEGEMEYIFMLGYYPQCPQPDKALGLIGHTDPSVLTLLIQDEPGLEVKKDGLWIPVASAPNGFIINIGDALQIMTNNKYESIEHRVLASKRRDRMSAMIFVQPNVHANLTVLRELVPSNTTAVYNDIPWGRHLEYAELQGLDAKLTSNPNLKTAADKL